MTSNNHKYNVTMGPSWVLVKCLEELVDDDYWAPPEYDEMTKYALCSSKVSEKTALHRVLYHLAYTEFYLYTYDDNDWASCDEDVINAIENIVVYMGIDIPHHYKTLRGLCSFITPKKFIEGLNVIVDSAFAIIWNQKQLLFEFNKLMAQYVKKCSQKDYPKIFQRNGVLQRVNFPQWLKKQIVYRDRGYCQYCGTQVESVDLVDGSYDIDHMVPLVQGGTNDPTNMILSCKHCNRSKRGNFNPVKDIFTWPERKNCVMRF